MTVDAPRIARDTEVPVAASSLVVRAAVHGVIASCSQLSDAVFKALRAGGNVLIPTDTAGRVLEIALKLDLDWAKAPPVGRGTPPALFIVSHVGSKTVRAPAPSATRSWFHFVHCVFCSTTLRKRWLSG
jgi:hypothetical protein